ncbi:TonB-dependent receptor [Mucilaginibacter flavidus]|uniref:TonB-dependent receptor n=1 Tax=Mucilaginibacter flavidus TaxID=2949309 RepID=UPI0020925AE3|nr:TonB-dependent receptor [Mucilaginibacter flavidus]MCO5946112.1 TonB-dependent receptor [Mucilaginibacter flavidus]
MIKSLTFLTLLLPFYAFSQAMQIAAGDTLIQSVTEKLNTYTANHSIEKAYLQFDKPYYAIGDTIYFKAYVTLGAQHKLSALSGIFYADLIGPGGNISRSIKLPIAAGVAWGDFVLADSLKGGNYLVRAYTNWMRNEGDDSFFDQSLMVGSASIINANANGGKANATGPAKMTAGKPDVQFLPEGGSLVIGNYSKIAFKAISPGGLGTDIKGTITDNDGTEVTTFASTHLGMGVFSLVPHADKTYKANITYADGTTGTVDLPKAVANGYTINLNNSNADTIRVRVAAGGDGTQSQLSLVAQVNGAVYYAVQSGPFAKFFNVVIPKSKFPTGVVQFTLFSQTGEPLNERLAFVQNPAELKLDINAKPTYTTRQKVEIELNAKVKDNKPATGSFSVAVTDETKVPFDELNENTILTNLLLTSVLKGNIEQPNYYFTNVNETTRADLDALMLTQGYRHFEWKQVLAGDIKPITWQPEKAMVISGTVKKGSKPVAGGKVTLLSKAGGMPVLLDTVTDDNGRFAFKNLAFNDSTKFVVQSKVSKGQDDVVLTIDSASARGVPVIHTPLSGLQTTVAVDMTAYVNNQKQFNDEQEKYGINKHPLLLKEVVVKEQKISPVPHSVNLNGPGNADQVISAKDIARFSCARITDCLSGVLSSVVFRNNVPLNMRLKMAPMAVVVDGDFVDATDFMYLNPDDIEGVEVVLGEHYAAIYGTRMANGGLIVTTKRGKKGKEYYRYAPGVATIRPKGFYLAKEFYSPQYDNSKTNPKITDLRSTIFWKPDIITDKNGKASFSYFNADGKGSYRMVIEGIDADGNLGRQVVRYKVE